MFLFCFARHFHCHSRPMPQVPLLGQEEEDNEVPNGVNGSNGATTSPLLISQLLPGQASEQGALLEAWRKLQG